MYRRTPSSSACAVRPSGYQPTSSWAKLMLTNTKNTAQLTTTMSNKTAAAAGATSMELSSSILPSHTPAASARSSLTKWKMMIIMVTTATFQTMNPTFITWHPRRRPCKSQIHRALAPTSWRMRHVRTPLSLTSGQRWIRFASMWLWLRSRLAARSCWSALSSPTSGRTSQRLRRSSWTKQVLRTPSAALTRSGSWPGAPHPQSLQADASEPLSLNTRRSTCLWRKRPSPTGRWSSLSILASH